MEGAASPAKIDGPDLDGPIVQNTNNYRLYQTAMRVDMYRKYGGKDAFAKHFAEKHQIQVLLDSRIYMLLYQYSR